MIDTLTIGLAVITVALVAIAGAFAAYAVGFCHGVRVGESTMAARLLEMMENEEGE